MATIYRSHRSRRPGVSQRRQRPAGRGGYINPEKFINKATAAEIAEVYNPEHTFADFGLKNPIQENIRRKGYIHPTPIQDQGIKPIMEGKDLIGLANTGTGKTGAFLLPIINNLLKDPQKVSVLIIVPTRELASQINDEFKIFAQNLHLYATVVVGGSNIQRQIQAVRRQPHVIIGTPGRLKDLVDRRELKFNNTHTLVLDEMDRMLDMGFIRDIQNLLALLPAQRQSLCYSATITPQIERILTTILKDPVTIRVTTPQTSSQIEQDVIKASSREEKIEILSELLTKPEFDKVLIFGDTKYAVQRLADKLLQKGIKAEAIHGNKSQSQRQRALKAFKDDKAQVLVATDVASRGLDINDVSHVINYDKPNTYEDYIHRIGRTGRAGKAGHALTFI
jgi:superfamily II DNA/RNA helicase